MIYQEMPACFEKPIEVANCFVECAHTDGYKVEILLLLRNPALPEPHADEWCIPGGKLERGEFARQCIRREIPEEIGIELLRNEPVFLRKVYGKRDDDYGKKNFIFFLFHHSLGAKPDVVLNAVNKNGIKEHTDYRWVTPESALEMRLIPDLDSMIKLCYPSNI